MCLFRHLLLNSKHSCPRKFMEVRCQIAELQEFSQCVYCKVCLCVCVCLLPGGLAALMYTDTFQTFVIIGGAFVLTGFCKYNSYSFAIHFTTNLFTHTTYSSCVWPASCSPEASRIVNRLTRGSNHSSGRSGVHCADTAEPPQSSPPPTDTTTTAPAPASLLICPYKVNMTINLILVTRSSQADKIKDGKEPVEEEINLSCYVNWQ